MLLSLLTIFPVSALVAVPVVQRIQNDYKSWQGQLSQAAVWALMPLALIWAVVCLDAGSTLQAGLCLLAALTVLLIGQSGGWETLISGRLTQFVLGGLALVFVAGSETTMQYLLAASLGVLAFLYDGLLELVGVAPEYASGEEWELPMQGTSELGDSVVPRKTRPRPPLPQAAEQTQVLERPPLPEPGQVAQWTTEQAEQAARDAEEIKRQAQNNWSRLRKV
jgi:hypothetical protein